MPCFNLLQNFVVTNFLHIIKLLDLNRKHSNNSSESTAGFAKLCILGILPANCELSKQKSL